MRRLRFIPEGGALVEVTCRTLHSRFLFRPGERVNPIIAGVLGRAQRMYGVRVCSFVVLSRAQVQRLLTRGWHLFGGQTDLAWLRRLGAG